jgi:SAM-dependent methyltransferase
MKQSLSEVDMLTEILSMVPEEGKVRRQLKRFFLETTTDYLQWMREIHQQLIQDTAEYGVMQSLMVKKTDALIAEGAELAGKIHDKTIVKKIKEVFREFLGEVMFEGKMLRWGYEKPHGYPGDYCILEGMYDRIPWTRKGIGCLWDNYLLYDAYVESVRKRKDYIKQLLKDIIERNNNEMRIFNIGSGSAREIRELFSERIICYSPIHFTLLDQEEQSLEYVRSKIKKISHPYLNCAYCNENITSFVKNPLKFRDAYGMQDIVYSIGVADYLPDIICQMLVQSGLELLKKNGLLIIAFKLVKECKSDSSDWCCDWKFYERSEREITALLAKSVRQYPGSIQKKHRLDNRIIYYTIKKS